MQLRLLQLMISTALVFARKALDQEVVLQQPFPSVAARVRLVALREGVVRRPRRVFKNSASPANHL